MNWVALLLSLWSLTALAAPIIGGEDVKATHPIYHSTVALVGHLNGKLDSFCTGTVISPKVILTAAHCVADIVSSIRSDIYVGHGQFPLKNKLVKVAKVKYFSRDYFSRLEFVPSTTGVPLEQQDIAILLLHAPLTGMQVVKIGKPSDLTPSTTFTQVGYGQNIRWDPFTDVSAHGELKMLENRGHAVLAEKSVLIPAHSDKTTASGDSGGPLYTQDAELKVHGVLSQISSVGAAENELTNLYTHPYYYLEWINCSLPADSKIPIQGQISTQVACDDVPLMTLSEARAFSKKLCSTTQPGHRLTMYGCWPATKKSCEKLALAVPWAQLQWTKKGCESVIPE